MKFDRRLKPNDQFSLSSIADIVFLLLIYFMVTASFASIYSIKVDLPTSKSGMTSEKNNTVTITADGNFYWNDTAIEKNEVNDFVKSALEDENKKSNTITLRTDKLVTMEDAAHVISAVAANKGQIVILTEKTYD